MDKLKKINELMSLPCENEIVEWKLAENNFNLDELGKYFSALSNEANLNNKKRAWIIFGVNDKKEIKGTRYKNSQKSLNKVKHEISQNTTNRISFVEIHELTVDSKRILLFEIPSSPLGMPIAWKGHFYGRDGESLSPLGLKYETIRSQIADKDWSIQICEEATINNLDTEAIKKAKEGFITKHPSIKKEDIMNWDVGTFLNKAKITINGKITNATILLLGKAESEHFINPATSKISWILKNKEGIEKDYEHFCCPLILSVDKVFGKIRNLRYRYIPDRSLFPEEIDTYDPKTIREALNNCIAHQDYWLQGKINVVENEDNCLIFSNLGSFIPRTVENVIESDSPPQYYRNKFLSEAMVNLNMIDTIGSGIKTMFISQKNKYFPLPDYDLNDNKVKVTIIGKVLDIKYARKLAQIPNLDLKIIMALDKVQKRKKLTKEENKLLRLKDLIEGRYPNIYISSKIAEKTDEKVSYIKNKGFDAMYYKDLIIEFLSKYKEVTRREIDDLLSDKLPALLNEEQKKKKIENLLQQMSRNNLIKNERDGRESIWKKLP